jgi:hypothetical protein
MALLGNFSANQRNPQRHFGLLSSGATAFVQGNERGGWLQHGRSKNFPLHDGDPTGANKTGYPSGRLHPYSWSMPLKPGGMAAIFTAEGVATASGAMAAGKNAAGTSAGVATAEATLQLVVSGVGTSNGVATATGNILAALAAAGTSAGVATASADITAKAWGVGTSNGVAAASLVSYATGSLSGSIAPAVTLEASSFSSYLLDEEDVETGLTMRKALRLIAAATAGKVSGANGSTVTIRNAVADGKDRIVATVDASGNRTAITYDLED